MVIVMTGIVVLLGHYIDVFNMIMPSAVGDQWFIGIAEIGGFYSSWAYLFLLYLKKFRKHRFTLLEIHSLVRSERFHY